MKKADEKLTATAKENSVRLTLKQADKVSMQELSDEQLYKVSGGVDYSENCEKNWQNGSMGYHDYRKTGTTTEGKLWFTNYEIRCIHCGKTEWTIFDPGE